MNLTDKISEYYTLRDAVFSPTAVRAQIDNMPTPEHLENIKAVATNVLDRLCLLHGFSVSSFYRSRALNSFVKGALHSQHLKGEAVDIDSRDNARLWQEIKHLYNTKQIDFDQLIWEFGDDNAPDWIHISYSRKKNRRQVLRAVKAPNKLGKVETVYRPIEL